MHGDDGPAEGPHNATALERPRVVTLAAVGVWIRAALRLPVLIFGVLSLVGWDAVGATYGGTLAILVSYEFDAWIIGCASVVVWPLVGSNPWDAPATWWVAGVVFLAVTAFYVLLGVWIRQGVRGAAITATVLSSLSLASSLLLAGYAIVWGLVATGPGTTVAEGYRADPVEQLFLPGLLLAAALPSLVVNLAVLVCANRAPARRYFSLRRAAA